ncbi:hypothetical protein Taro_037746 [Colocasia esculenta]|uniref:Uncharacterized protein n=1 Tax=Colocasia esculenta TaxID=4460 RepID=A0A843WK70_COLES|nr:hypothetical protein [Colocasia esculenta]
MLQVRARSHNFDRCEDDILDISSGVLHIACGSLVPESISRDSLEHAKVLLQVDRKFILVVAGGILVAIDQSSVEPEKYRDLNKSREANSSGNPQKSGNKPRPPHSNTGG